MNKLTAEEILKIVEENYSENNFCDGEWHELETYTEGETEEDILNRLGLGKVVEVGSYGGEGQGDTYYSVKHFVDHDVYIKINGHYSSYNGVEFYDGYGKEVFPKQETRTIYK